MSSKTLCVLISMTLFSVHSVMAQEAEEREEGIQTLEEIVVESVRRVATPVSGRYSFRDRRHEGRTSGSEPAGPLCRVGSCPEGARVQSVNRRAHELRTNASRTQLSDAD